MILCDLTKIVYIETYYRKSAYVAKLHLTGVEAFGLVFKKEENRDTFVKIIRERIRVSSNGVAGGRYLDDLIELIKSIEK